LSIDPADSLHAITYRMPMASAQVKSAILLAGLYADGTTSVEEATPTRDHTERLLGIKPERSEKGSRLSVEGGRKIEARDYTIPGDPSSAAFLVAAAILIPGSEILIRDVGLNPSRIGFLGHLLQLGAHIEIQSLHVSSGEPFGNVLVRASQLQGDLHIAGEQAAEVIDEIPILATTALAAGCGGSVRNARELRSKESDRIQMLVKNMRALGAEVEEYDDGFSFSSNTHLIGTTIMSAMDHRIAMSFGVIGCVIPGISIEGAEHASISYPQFWKAIGVHA
jgi:3-phosphoshikimate 1-carboxyvinyltransferase